MPTEKKITYLLGAGASYNALPIVSEIPAKLKEMATYMRIYNLEKFGKELPLTQLWKDIVEIEKHASIDTLARKYWLLHQENFTNPAYLRIKQIISCLLIYCQVSKPVLSNQKHVNEYITVKNRKKYLIDPRYESFFSAILTKNIELPENISILSWNYDFQIEKSFDFYHQNESIMETGRNIGFDYMVAKSDSNSSMIKLNGTSFFVNGHDPKLVNYKTYDNELHNLFHNVLSDNFNENVYPGIKFSWETNSDLASENRLRAADKVKSSDFIVIIGYSFPLFNREIDIQIFKDIGHCKAIYIQDNSDRVEQIRNQLDAVNPKINSKGIVKLQTELNQFFIPNEYWVSPQKGSTNAFIV
jgi:hypothetical protein